MLFNIDRYLSGAMISKSTLSSRFVQLAINGFTVVFGFCTFMPLGSVMKYFSQCILYADLSVSTDPLQGNVTVDAKKTIWGSNCNFATYVPMVAAIHAFIWCWFFLLMKAVLKEENREHYLLMPSFLLHSIILLVVFVSSSIVSAGADTFCHRLTRTLNQKYTCSESFDLYWEIFRDGKKHSIHRFLLTAKIFTWLMTLTILAQCVLTGYKLYLWYLRQTANTEKDAPKTKHSSPKKKGSKTKTNVDSSNGSDNSAYLVDSSSDSSILSLDVDGANQLNVFVDDDESDSLIHVL